MTVVQLSSFIPQKFLGTDVYIQNQIDHICIRQYRPSAGLLGTGHMLHYVLL